MRNLFFTKDITCLLFFSRTFPLLLYCLLVGIADRYNYLLPFRQRLTQTNLKGSKGSDTHSHRLIASSSQSIDYFLTNIHLIALEHLIRHMNTLVLVLVLATTCAMSKLRQTVRFRWSSAMKSRLIVCCSCLRSSFVSKSLPYYQSN